MVTLVALAQAIAAWVWLAFNQSPPSYDQSGHLNHTLDLARLVAHPGHATLNVAAVATAIYPPVFPALGVPATLLARPGDRLATASVAALWLVLVPAVYLLGRRTRRTWRRTHCRGAGRRQPDTDRPLPPISRRVSAGRVRHGGHRLAMRRLGSRRSTKDAPSLSRAVLAGAFSAAALLCKSTAGMYLLGPLVVFGLAALAAAAQDRENCEAPHRRR